MSYQHLLLFTIVLLVIDLTWIKLVMSKLYTNLFTNIRFQIIPAIIAYLFMILSYVFFILPNKNNIQKYLIQSFIFGIILFGVYAFTLLSFLPNFKWNISFIETIWGGLLYTLSSYITILILQKK